MNVKIAEESVTFKIREEEMNHLLSGTPLEKTIMIGGAAFSMFIIPRPGSAALALSGASAESRLTLHIAPDDIRRLHDMGKNKDGLSFRVDGIDIFLQVDMRQDSRSRKA